MSCGFEVENRKRVLGNFVAHMSSNSAKPTAVACAISVAFLKSFLRPPPNHKKLSTFCPRSVISLKLCATIDPISSRILFGSLLLSRPLVKGTTQKVHMLSQPLVIETNAVTPFVFKRTGDISP